MEDAVVAYYSVKLVVTALLIVLISEFAKRNSFVGALLASAPLVSVIAIVWLYVDTKDVERISTLSDSIFWLVLPSLALFIVLPLMLKAGVNFYLSMGLSIGVTALCYWLLVTTLSHFGVKL